MDHVRIIFCENILKMSNSFIESFRLGKALQIEDTSNVTTRKKEITQIRAILNKWQSCLNPQVKQLLLLEDDNSLSEFSLNSSMEEGLLKENAFIGLRDGT